MRDTHLSLSSCFLFPSGAAVAALISTLALPLPLCLSLPSSVSHPSLFLRVCIWARVTSTRNVKKSLHNTRSLCRLHPSTTSCLFFTRNTFPFTCSIFFWDFAVYWHHFAYILVTVFFFIWLSHFLIFLYKDCLSLFSCFNQNKET